MIIIRILLKSKYAQLFMLTMVIAANLFCLGLSFNLTKSDWAAWVQAIGSICALGVAIYVMSRQNANAARLIVDADALALRRRASAVSALVTRAMRIIERACSLMTTPIGPIDDLDTRSRQIQESMENVRFMIEKFEAIPAHELGSYEIVTSLTMLQGGMASLQRQMLEKIQVPALIGVPGTIENVRKLLANIESAHERFEKGVLDLA